MPAEFLATQSKVCTYSTDATVLVPALHARKAKVRCLISQRRDRCDRCITNDFECVFAQTKRARVRTQPYPQRPRPKPRAGEDDNRPSVDEVTSTTNIASSSQNEPSSVHLPRRSNGHRAISVDSQPQLSQRQQPVITNAVRARVIAALATLKGKRGAPFSFVTSGDNPAFSLGPGANDGPARDSEPESFEHSQVIPYSLKLSWLLRP